MPPPKLDRSTPHALAVSTTDTVEIWPSQFHDDRHNVSVHNLEGNNVLVLYAFTRKQLTELSLAIAEALGKPPDLTREHLLALHESLGRLVGRTRPVDPPRPPEPEPTRLYVVFGVPQRPFVEPPYPTDPRPYGLPLFERPIPDEEFEDKFRDKIKAFLDRNHALAFASHCDLDGIECPVFNLVDDEWVYDADETRRMAENIT